MKKLSIDDFSKILPSPSEESMKKFVMAEQLLVQVKSNRQRVESLLNRFKREEPDLVYRFYHQSFKVFIATSLVKKAIELFEELTPEDSSMNTWFLEIVKIALSKEFGSETNAIWLQETRPVLEAMWHCKYFLEQMLVAADGLGTAPHVLPSGWAAVLYLYDLR